MTPKRNTVRWTMTVAERFPIIDPAKVVLSSACLLFFLSLSFFPPHVSPTSLASSFEQDDKYWARRRKNNMAAKRSRDARRLKENQIAIRASFLEKENSALRLEVADLRKELGRTKNILAKYEAQHGPL